MHPKGNRSDLNKLAIDHEGLPQSFQQIRSLHTEGRRRGLEGPDRRVVPRLPSREIPASFDSASRLSAHFPHPLQKRPHIRGLQAGTGAGNEPMPVSLFREEDLSLPETPYLRPGLCCQISSPSEYPDVPKAALAASAYLT